MIEENETGFSRNVCEPAQVPTFMWAVGGLPSRFKLLSILLSTAASYVGIIQPPAWGCRTIPRGARSAFLPPVCPRKPTRLPWASSTKG